MSDSFVVHGMCSRDAWCSLHELHLLPNSIHAVPSIMTLFCMRSKKPRSDLPRSDHLKSIRNITVRRCSRQDALVFRVMASLGAWFRSGAKHLCL